MNNKNLFYIIALIGSILLIIDIYYIDDFQKVSSYYGIISSVLLILVSVFNIRHLIKQSSNQ
jgi:hypothetical protein